MKESKEITKVVEIANNVGLDAFTDEYTDADTDQEMVSIQFRDEHSGMIVSIHVAPDVDKKDLSDELYMLADDFNEEFIESDRIPELKEEEDQKTLDHQGAACQRNGPPGHRQRVNEVFHPAPEALP